ncbi:MAG: leucine-rich repeat domain-containing protein [Christensenellales bacterium]|nr:leucine-rich repeat domain-containing protein [Clostridiales bacterium]
MRKILLLLLIFICLTSLAEEPKNFSSLDEAKIFLQTSPEAACTIKNLWLSPQERQELKSTYPQATIKFTDSLEKITLSDEMLDFVVEGPTEIDKNQIEALIKAYPNIQTIDLYETRLPRVDMLYLFDTYPNVHFGFTVRFAEHVVRTDATAFSTLHNNQSLLHPTELISCLRMCRNLMALDIGRNLVEDLSFLEYMPKLRLLIIGCNPVRDISPIGTLKDLEYLEMFSCRVNDISPLQNCTKLIDLNIAHNRIKDLSPLLKMPQLERLWLNESRGQKNDPVIKELLPLLEKALPCCVIDSSSMGTGGKWRFHPRYEIVYDIFNQGEWRAWDDTENLLPAENR